MIDRELLRDRLVSSYEHLKGKGLIHSKSDLARVVGVRINNLNDAFGLRGNYMNESLLERIADTFPDILNREYLLTGIGEVGARDKNMRPHYDAKASAGFMDGISDGKMSAEFRAMIIPTLKYDFSIDTKGDSMLPRIEDGDTLLCRVSADRANPPVGKICVIDTKDGAVVKVIKRINEETITLHSLNPEYKDYDIELSAILGIAEVVGLTRLF